MIRIRKYQEADWGRVKELSVQEDQVKYVGTIAGLFAAVPPNWNFHLIEADNQIVGFFNLDTAYAVQYEFANNGELGLRAFFIDAAHQGKGYGTAAVKALHSYLQDNYPGYPAVCLTVNSQNQAAYKCYLRGGFEDTGGLYHGGRAGPQHIMRMRIAD